jgi:hypothetical protein
MQFIANGPDIPDALLQAHEDGRVVFSAALGFLTPPVYQASRAWWMRSIA